MRKIYLMLVAICFATAVNAQVTVSGGTGAAGAYGTLAAAITAINGGGALTGPVTVDVVAGHTETITAPIELTMTGTAANTILIQKSTGGVNPLITSYVGGTATPTTLTAQDGIFRLVGCDYVTIDAIDLAENAANVANPATMEYGYGFFKASATDGCQNNRIQNCAITLNRINNDGGSGPSVDGSKAINVVNATVAAPTIALAITSAAGSNSNNRFYANTINNCNIGIALIGFADVTPFTFADAGNDVGGVAAGTGNQIYNYGGGGVTSPAAGIRTLAQYGLNISYNTIDNNNGGGVNHASTLRGIYTNTATSASETITNNNVTVRSGATTSQLAAIENVAGSTAAGNTISINNNTITTQYSTATSGVTYGVYNNGATPATLNVNSNTFTMSTAATSGSLYGIFQAGGVVTTCNTNSNNISSVTCSAATTSLTFRGIFLSSGTATLNWTANSNNIQSVTFTAHTGAFHFLYNSNTILSETVNSNTITNLTIPTTGTIQLIYLSNSTNNVTVNANSIVTGFTNTVANASSFMVLYNFGSPSTLTQNISNNNFSNITINRSAGTTIGSSTGLYGIYWATNAGVTHNIFNNTVSNVTNTGTGMLHGMSVQYAIANNVYNNTITNISSGGAAQGLQLGNGTTVALDAYNNTISSITSTGAATAANGMIVGTAAGTGPSGAVNIYKNNICGVSATGATGVAQGFNFLGAASTNTSNVYNNLIGNITAPNSTSATAVAGITVGNSTANAIRLFYNTVYISGTSLGSGFGSSAMNLNTTPTVDARNNIFFNGTTPTGAGRAVAHRRTSTTLTSYSANSNNNLFYAGVPGASNLIYFDGTNSDQTLGAYKTRVAARDASSVTEDISAKFLSTVCGDPNFLHMNTTIATQVESGGVAISSPISITDDYDGNARGATPDIGADEFAGIALDVTGPSIVYTALTNSTCFTAPTFVATITDATGVNTAPGTKPRLWYRKGTNLNVLPGTNDNTTDGWKYVEATNASSPFSFTFDYTLLFGGVPVAGDVIHYFVVAQDIVATPNLSINTGTFTTPPPTVALNAGAFPVSGNNTFTLLIPIATSVTIGAAGTYLTLTGAGGLFAAINTGGLSGNTTATILDPAIAETGANALNQIAYGCAGTYTLTIKPDVGISPVLSGSFAGPLIDLNGADNVTFDGSNNGSSSKDMTIVNTSTTGQTIRFINDATSNTVKNCILQGVNTSATSGTIVFSTSTGTLGNSSNTINNCDVRDGATVPANAIYSSGTAGAPNATNTISGCNVFNYTNAGVLVAATGAGNGWTVNPSSFYQTSARTTAIWGISIQGGSGHSILNNSIGGTAPLAAGANLATNTTFRGIDLTVGTASATSVQGNTIKNIRSTFAGSFTASYGILLNAGMANIGNITGNTVGSSSVAERIEINGDSYGIRIASTSTCNISNNTVNNMTTTTGVPTGEYYFGIYIDGAGGAHTVTNNTVMNLTNGSTPDASFDTRLIGLINAATGTQIVRGNIVHDIGNTSVTTSVTLRNRVWGIILSGTGVGSVCEKNTVYNLYGSSGGVAAFSDVISLIQTEGTANATVSNNMVSSGTVNTVSDRAIFGFVDLGTSPVNFYYNSANITGTGTAANNTYGFIKGNTATVTLRNNIFSNTRAGGTGFHVAIANGNATATGWAATASDYNDLYSSNPATVAQWLGTAAVNNRTLAAWQAAQPAGSGGDANSLSLLPLFNGTNDLHLTTAAGFNCQFDGAATPISVVDDYDNNSRDATAPDMGADEFTSVPSATLASTVCSNANVGSSGKIYKDANCNAIARVVPNGGSPVSGMVNTCVTIDGAVMTYGGQAYLQRHFDITPAVNQSTATARITLYAYQSEFDAYNLANGVEPDLMTGPGDVAGKANLRVTKYSGNGGPTPGSYSPGVATFIDPADADIIWNGNYWEISFDVTGFSGFFIHAGLGPLPVSILNFSGYKDGSRNQLRWTTSSEQNNSGFEMQRSTDGINYTALGFVNTLALGGNSTTDLNYAFTDNNVIGSKQYYRLRQVNFDGNSKLSNIVLIKGDKPLTLVIDGLFPNPASTQVNVLIGAPNKDKVTLVVSDIAGRTVVQKIVNVETGSNTIPVDITTLANGTYMVKLVCSSNCESAVGKFVKQ